MRPVKNVCTATLLISISVSAYSQIPKAEIQQKLQSEYALTQPTADKADIVTAGSILVLKKGNIMMAPVSNTNLFQNTYKDGKMSQGFVGQTKRFGDMIRHVPGASAPNGPDSRTFVPGEKMWVTKIEVKDDGVNFGLFTDAYSDVRYQANVKFQFPKGWTPTTDQVEKVVAEVFKVQPPDDTKDAKSDAVAPTSSGKSTSPAPVAAPPAPAEPAAVIPPPPPPPPADPQTISKGQTKDEVVATFGQPKKIVKLGTKEIFVYADLKVTFVAGKVTNVE